MPFFLLHQKFLEMANKFPDKTALRSRISAGEYKKYTYAEVAGLSKAAGIYFINQGIKKSDRIALILENGLEWPVFYFGILFSGAIAVPVDPQLTEPEIKNILSDSGAKFVISASNSDEIMKNLKAAPPDFRFPEVAIEDPASILYTSGTTASPKGVVLSHRNLSGNHDSVDRLNICSESDNVISLLPLHHAYSFAITLELPLFKGASVTYIRTLKPQEIISAMRETGVTMLIGVPQLFYLFHKGIFEKIKEIPAVFRFFLWPLIARKIRRNFGSKLRLFASGGARLEPKIVNDLLRLGFTVLEGYGLTETSPVVTFNFLMKQHPGSVGIPVPGVEIKISNPDRDGIGEVLIKGPNVMQGYYKRPKETEEVIKDGWFHSGDLGFIGADGYLVLTGRQKEVIVLSNGKNIYPDEIEQHYKKSPFIKELCVLGIFKEGITEELGAVIVPDMEYFRKTGDVNIRENIKWNLEGFSKELSGYKRIISFVIAKEDLPKTRLGKIKRYEVEKAYRDRFNMENPVISSRKPEAEDLAILNSEAGQKIVKFLTQGKNIKRVIGPGDHLELDLGMDSLSRVELAVGLEKVFDIHIPDNDIMQVFTVKDVILKINELIQNQARGEKATRIISDDTVWEALLKKDPKDAIKEKIDLLPGPLSKAITFLGDKFLYAVFKLFFNLKIKGEKNIPREGPFILCPNHSSYLDAFVVAASLPYDRAISLFFLGFREYFSKPLIRNMIKLMRVVPVDPAAQLVNAMQASSYIIRHKKSLCIFPEGQRSIDGKIKEFKKGISILAKETNVELIPVYIDGAFKAWSRGKMFTAACPITVIFGSPLSSEHLLKIGRAGRIEDDYEAIAVGLREEMLKLTR